MSIKARSKVVEIDIELWDGTQKALDAINVFAGSENVRWHEVYCELQLWNYLEKQWITCPIGHYVLRGLKNEYYPCEPGAFFMKYDIIDD